MRLNSDLQHANFDVIKLPVLEVCFYTPRSGGVTSVLHAIINMSCFSWLHHQWTHRKLVVVWSECRWFICLAHQGQGRTWHVCLKASLAFRVSPNSCRECSLKLICMIDCELVVKNQQHYLDKVGHAMCLKALTCFPGFPQLLSQNDAHSCFTCVWSWNLPQRRSSKMLTLWSTRLDMKCVWKLQLAFRVSPNSCRKMMLILCNLLNNVILLVEWPIP